MDFFVPPGSVDSGSWKQTVASAYRIGWCVLSKVRPFFPGTRAQKSWIAKAIKEWFSGVTVPRAEMFMFLKTAGELIVGLNKGADLLTLYCNKNEKNRRDFVVAGYVVLSWHLLGVSAERLIDVFDDGTVNMAVSLSHLQKLQMSVMSDERWMVYEQKMLYCFIYADFIKRIHCHMCIELNDSIGDRRSVTTYECRVVSEARAFVYSDRSKIKACSLERLKKISSCILEWLTRELTGGGNRALCRRAWGRALGQTSKAPPSALRDFFQVYPGLRAQIGGKILLYYSPSSAWAF